MKKIIYMVIFGVLFFIMNSCNNVEQEVIFLRGDVLNTIGESSLIDNIKNSNLKFKEVILRSGEEFDKYLSGIQNSRKGLNQTFIVSESFSNNEIINSDFIQLYGNREGGYNLNIYQKDLVYLFGIVSGMITKSNNVSIIYSSNFKDFPEYLLSFIAGIKTVNLRAYDLILNGVNTLNTFGFNEDEKKVNINNFIKNNKSDVIFYLDDNIVENLSDTLDEKTKTIFSLYDFIDNDYLKISYGYDDIINKNSNSGNYILSLVNNTININFDNLPEEVRLVVEGNFNRIMDEDIHIPSSLSELKNMLIR